MEKKNSKTLHSELSSNGDIDILDSTVFSTIFEPHLSYLEKCKSDVFQITLRGQPSWSWSYGNWITTTYAISVYHHQRCEFEPHSWRGVLDTTLYDKVCQWLTEDTRVSSPIKLATTI